MIRVGILGATGYTALELIKILLRHPQVQIVAVTSRQEGSPPISSVHHCLTGRLDLPLENVPAREVAAKSDCVFSCLPHAASAPAVVEALDEETRVIDFSADYRLNDADVYQHWYGCQHVDPRRLGETPYGLGEWFADDIRQAKLVANPGCYPTSAILPLAPLLKEKLIEPTDLIIDSKSGVSGAGRTPKLVTHFPECNESIAAYNVGRHRHTPEITQVLTIISGQSADIIFTPHLVPMDRGILTTTYAKKRQDASAQDALQVLRAAYRSEPFVRIVDHLPATKDTRETNYCDITVCDLGQRLVTVSSIDNLIKGASGAAVQSMNLMFGFPVTTALQ